MQNVLFWFSFKCDLYHPSIHIHFEIRVLPMSHSIGLAESVNSPIDLGQHRFLQWLVVWRYQAINWTNFDLLSIKACGIHLGAVEQKMVQIRPGAVTTR